MYQAFAQRNTALTITERDIEEFTLTTAPGYVGYYEANGCILMAQYGDAANDQIA